MRYCVSLVGNVNGINPPSISLKFVIFSHPFLRCNRYLIDVLHLLLSTLFMCNSQVKDEVKLSNMYYATSLIHCNPDVP